MPTKLVDLRNNFLCLNYKYMPQKTFTPLVKVSVVEQLNARK